MSIDNLFQQGAQAHCGYLCQRSYSTMGEAEIDHLRVPASRIATGQAQNRQVDFLVFMYGYRNLQFILAFWTLPSVRTVIQIWFSQVLRLIYIYWKLVSDPYGGLEHLPHEY